jgi:hypothetical protein
MTSKTRTHFSANQAESITSALLQRVRILLILQDLLFHGIPAKSSTYALFAKNMGGGQVVSFESFTLAPLFFLLPLFCATLPFVFNDFYLHSQKRGVYPSPISLAASEIHNMYPHSLPPTSNSLHHSHLYELLRVSSPSTSLSGTFSRPSRNFP